MLNLLHLTILRFMIDCYICFTLISIFYCRDWRQLGHLHGLLVVLSMPRGITLVVSKLSFTVFQTIFRAYCQCGNYISIEVGSVHCDLAEFFLFDTRKKCISQLSFE